MKNTVTLITTPLLINLADGGGLWHPRGRTVTAEICIQS